MKIARLAAPLITVLAVLVASCGGGGGGDLAGPVLNVSDLTSVVLDQFYMNGGMEDEYGGKGEFSVYIRDSATGQDVACTTQNDGMDGLASAGVYYGELSVPFTKVEGVSVDSVARFRLVFVEKDNSECPDPIGDEDDIAGESDEFTSEGLLGSAIWTDNGRAAAVLRSGSDDVLTIHSMAPAIDAGLYIDRLYLDYDPPEGTAPRFYINVNVAGGDQCQIDDDLMGSVISPRILYAALNFPISCVDGSAADFSDTRVSLAVYAQEDSGPQLIGETESTAIADLVGERVKFKDNEGYVTFRGISPVLFGASVVRLADLVTTQITKISHTTEPETAGVLEVHVVDATSGKTLACAGAAQGLAGIEGAGTYAGLAAVLSAAGWERELFGYDSIYFTLVERSDGLACPTLPSGDLPMLAKTGNLTPAELLTNKAEFEDSRGSIEFAAAPAN